MNGDKKLDFLQICIESSIAIIFSLMYLTAPQRNALNWTGTPAFHNIVGREFIKNWNIFVPVFISLGLRKAGTITFQLFYFLSSINSLCLGQQKGQQFVRQKA